MDLVYCYKDSNVLINKLNIQSESRLRDAERKLTSLRIQDLLEEPIEGRFDFAHLKEIHKYIFQDLYNWAGKIRTVDIAKGNMFCKFQYIDMQANEIFNKLKLEKHLKYLDLDTFIKRLAYYFSEINALHPFREGNGRTQREFIRELALNSGYVLNFSKISEKEMMEASIESFLCRYDKMEMLFKNALEL